MTSQEKKQWLSRYTKLKISIDQKTNELEEIRSLCEKVTTTFSDMPRASGSSTKDNVYSRLVLASEKIMDSISDMIDIREEIESVINMLPDIQLQTLLRYRYISGFKWEYIANKMNYSIQHIYELHGDALQKIEIIERSE